MAQTARAAALALTGSDEAETETLAVLALAGAREAFTKLDGEYFEKLASAAIVAHLVAKEGEPWAEMGRVRKPLTPNGLARLLKPFGISPNTIRQHDGTTPKGYMVGRLRASMESLSAAY